MYMLVKCVELNIIDFSDWCRLLNHEVLLSPVVRNLIVYLVAVLFRQKYSMVSVTVVGLANLSCSCDHCMNGENEPDTK